MAKYDRTNFYKHVIVDKTEESDLLTNTFNTFNFHRQSRYYKVTSEDVARPDLISFKMYDKLDYWWIIMKVNNIQDPWNDLDDGDVLKIPDILDIEEFYMKNRNSNR